MILVVFRFVLIRTIRVICVQTANLPLFSHHPHDQQIRVHTGTEQKLSRW